ncbi:MAG: hypothetical protein ACRDAM_06960 [Casimicrobium sp.]
MRLKETKHRAKRDNWYADNSRNQHPVDDFTARANHLHDVGDPAADCYQSKPPAKNKQRRKFIPFHHPSPDQFK